MSKWFASAPVFAIFIVIIFSYMLFGSGVFQPVMGQVSSVASPPQPPTKLTTAVVSSSQINLSWIVPSDDGGSPIIGYMIDRSTDNGDTWPILISNTDSNATTYPDTGLSANTRYAYRVAAINSVGTSFPSNPIFATTTSNIIIPQSPTGLTATAASSSQINLSWTAPNDNGGSPITGYQIERSPDSGSTWSIIANTGTTTYPDTGLQSSTTYTYRVSAINSVGTSSPSNTAAATTPNSNDDNWLLGFIPIVGAIIYFIIKKLLPKHKSKHKPKPLHTVSVKVGGGIS